MHMYMYVCGGCPQTGAVHGQLSQQRMCSRQQAILMTPITNQCLRNEVTMSTLIHERGCVDVLRREHSFPE